MTYAFSQRNHRDRSRTTPMHTDRREVICDVQNYLRRVIGNVRPQGSLLMQSIQIVYEQPDPH